MKLRIYLDTSVISAYFDERAPDRMAETRLFWAKLGQVEVSTSVLVREELERTPDPERRAAMLRLLQDTRQAEVTAEAHDLARAYLRRGLFTPAMYGDALHLAVAVLTRHDMLISWNFRHLVNRRKRAEVTEANVALDLPAIEILSPPEL